MSPLQFVYIKLVITALWVSFFVVLSEGESLSRSGFFTMHKDRYLLNHVIYSTSVTSQLECAMQCLERDECQSWNFEKRPFGYNCELNNVTMETTSHSYLITKEGAQFGQRFSQATQDHTRMSFLFSSLGARGRSGPSDVTGYVGTSLEGQVALKNGIQEWAVPFTGTYEIEACGASGANGTCRRTNHSRSWQLGGLGSKMKGKFNLIQGTFLKILVGQAGVMNTDFGDRPGGGGGGTFVTYANNTPMVVAGGGGGGGGCVVQGVSDGDPGQQGELGSRCNGTLKQGGVLCSDDEKGYTAYLYAGAGAGLLGDGRGITFPIGAYSFVNGGTGGRSTVQSHGGFGGGGYGWKFGGGGGGYSGGGVQGNSVGGVAGGGGSFNKGFHAKSGRCDSRGHGSVKIDLIEQV